jgi:hypothetical protein
LPVNASARIIFMKSLWVTGFVSKICESESYQPSVSSKFYSMLPDCYNSTNYVGFFVVMPNSVNNRDTNDVRVRKSSGFTMCARHEREAFEGDLGIWPA